MNLEPALLDWLNGSDHAPAAGWESEPAAGELHCAARLVARLTEAARPIGDVRRRFVAGCPVVHHPRGTPIAAAAGDSWFVVRSGMPAGALHPTQPFAAALTADWIELDPWAITTAFASAIDLLRGHLARAYELAEASA